MKKIYFLFLTFLVLTCTYSQNVGIGTTSPISKLTIQTPDNTDGLTHVSNGGIVLTEHIGGVSASIGTTSNHAFRLLANNNPIINLDVLGNVGVGLTDQTFKMDIADRIRIRSGSGSSTAGIWFNNLDNSSSISFLGTKDVDLFGIYGNTSGWGFAMNTNTGNVSIGNTNPVAGYKLAVQGNQYVNGLLATTGAAEIGADAQVSGTLNVNGSTTVLNQCYAYYGRKSDLCQELFGAFASDITYSIHAAGPIYAQEYYAFSDARIKDVTGISNTTNDLNTINSLKITDYTMRDKVKYGNKTFKKVIAQEVEKVYPQVVSQHPDFVPNIYQVTSRVEKTANGYLLTFTGKHNISKTAKKLQLLLSEEKGMQQFNIVSIPSEYKVVIDAKGLEINKVFVYGEEVYDFRTVDYEGLTTLNISATQELSKLVKQQQAALDAQSLQIKALIQAVKLLKERGCAGVQ